MDKQFWVLMKQYVDAMTPVYTFLREVDTTKTMMGKIYYRMSEINQHFVKVDEAAHEVFKEAKMADMFVHRWNSSAHLDFHSAGA
jgi:hypothetical protein